MTGWTKTFFLMMIIHPEIQRRAQAELDAVVGRRRLPNLQDRANLPYLGAIQKEIYRWAAIVPLGELCRAAHFNVLFFIYWSIGIPHCATEDIVYESQFIPKDSLLVNNIWYVNFKHSFDTYSYAMLGKLPMIPKTMSNQWHSTQTDSWIAKPYLILIPLFLALGEGNVLELKLHNQRYLLL
jgi:hypothetical protein